MSSMEVKNSGGGLSFQVCDMQRLQRFIVLGTEENSYYATRTELMIESVQCVRRLLENNHHKELLDLIEKYSVEGRVPKEDPIIVVLAICACAKETSVRQAAYEKVNSICNIPTKLFQFIERTHNEIERQRSLNPPQPQLRKRKLANGESSQLENIDKEIEQIKIKEPVESNEPSLKKKKGKKKKDKKPVSEFKKVNIEPRRSIGWGRLRRRGISTFYTDEKKEPSRLLYLLTKYKNRNNWNHQQVLTYAHPKMTGENSEAKNLVLKYCARGYDKVEKEMNEMVIRPGISESICEIIAYIQVINDISKLSPTTDGDLQKLLEHLNKYAVRQKKKENAMELAIPGLVQEENKCGMKSSIQIVREHIPTGFLKDISVWETLLVDMPMMAMIRNLGKMSSMGMFNKDSNTEKVVKALNNEYRLQTARVHPMKILIAMKVYGSGKGVQGSLEWQPNSEIKKALDGAFYKCFRTPSIAKNYKTNKKFMLCLDISGSMTCGACQGCPYFSPALASIAMAMVTWNVEDDVNMVAFGSSLKDMKQILRKDMTIEQAMRASQNISMGATDCSLPIVYAMKCKQEVDCFIVYTDSETNDNRVPPVEALRYYNKHMDRDAKLIVCAMQSNGFTIADPNDRNCLDVVGFDDGVPDVMSNFARGNMSTRCNVCKECQLR